MKSFLAVVKNLVFPPRCGGCHALLSPVAAGEDAVFCAECKKEWHAELCLQCPDCYLAYPDCRCQPSVLQRAGSKGLLKLAPYGDTARERVVRRIVLDMKSGACRRVTATVAKELAASLHEELFKLKWEKERIVVAHLPRDARNVRRHGIDQAKVLARALAWESGLSYASLLHRKARAKTQKKLSAKERAENLRDAFGVNEIPSGCCVVLVDDVVTTGASLAAAATALRKAGVKDLICVCIAQTPKKH